MEPDIYWRAYHPATLGPIAGNGEEHSVHSVLASDVYTVEHILEADDVLQELKNGDTSLLQFLYCRETLKSLVQYAISLPPDVSTESRCYKYPFVACELLCNPCPSVVQCLVGEGNEDILDFLWDFLSDRSLEESVKTETQGEAKPSVGGLFEVVTSAEGVITNGHVEPHVHDRSGGEHAFDFSSAVGDPSGTYRSVDTPAGVKHDRSVSLSDRKVLEGVELCEGLASRVQEESLAVASRDGVGGGNFGENGGEALRGDRRAAGSSLLAGESDSDAGGSLDGWTGSDQADVWASSVSLKEGRLQSERFCEQERLPSWGDGEEQILYGCACGVKQLAAYLRRKPGHIRRLLLRLHSRSLAELLQTFLVCDSPDKAIFNPDQIMLVLLLTLAPHGDSPGDLGCSDMCGEKQENISMVIQQVMFSQGRECYFYPMYMRSLASPTACKVLFKLLLMRHERTMIAVIEILSSLCTLTCNATAMTSSMDLRAAVMRPPMRNFDLFGVDSADDGLLSAPSSRSLDCYGGGSLHPLASVRNDGPQDEEGGLECGDPFDSLEQVKGEMASCSYNGLEMHVNKHPEGRSECSSRGLNGAAVAEEHVEEYSAEGFWFDEAETHRGLMDVFHFTQVAVGSECEGAETVESNGWKDASGTTIREDNTFKSEPACQSGSKATMDDKHGTFQRLLELDTEDGAGDDREESGHKKCCSDTLGSRPIGHNEHEMPPEHPKTEEGFSSEAAAALGDEGYEISRALNREPNAACLSSSLAHCSGFSLGSKRQALLYANILERAETRLHEESDLAGALETKTCPLSRGEPLPECDDGPSFEMELDTGIEASSLLTLGSPSPAAQSESQLRGSVSEHLEGGLKIREGDVRAKDEEVLFKKPQFSYERPLGREEETAYDRIQRCRAPLLSGHGAWNCSISSLIDQPLGKALKCVLDTPTVFLFDTSLPSGAVYTFPTDMELCAIARGQFLEESVAENLWSLRAIVERCAERLFRFIKAQKKGCNAVAREEETRGSNSCLVGGGGLTSTVVEEVCVTEEGFASEGRNHASGTGGREFGVPQLRRSPTPVPGLLEAIVADTEDNRDILSLEKESTPMCGAIGTPLRSSQCYMNGDPCAPEDDDDRQWGGMCRSPTSAPEKAPIVESIVGSGVSKMTDSAAPAIASSTKLTTTTVSAIHNQIGRSNTSGESALLRSDETFSTTISPAERPICFSSESCITDAGMGGETGGDKCSPTESKGCGSRKDLSEEQCRTLINEGSRLSSVEEEKESNSVNDEDSENALVGDPPLMVLQDGGRPAVGLPCLLVLHLFKVLIRRTAYLSGAILGGSFVNLLVKMFLSNKWNTVLHLCIGEILQTVVLQRLPFSVIPFKTVLDWELPAQDALECAKRATEKALRTLICETCFVDETVAFFREIRRIRLSSDLYFQREKRLQLGTNQELHVAHVAFLVNAREREFPEDVQHYLRNHEGWQNVVLEEVQLYANLLRSPLGGNIPASLLEDIDQQEAILPLGLGCSFPTSLPFGDAPCGHDGFPSQGGQHQEQQQQQQALEHHCATNGSVMSPSVIERHIPPLLSSVSHEETDTSAVVLIPKEHSSRIAVSETGISREALEGENDVEESEGDDRKGAVLAAAPLVNASEAAASSSQVFDNNHTAKKLVGSCNERSGSSSSLPSSSQNRQGGVSHGITENEGAEDELSGSSIVGFLEKFSRRIASSVEDTGDRDGIMREERVCNFFGPEKKEHGSSQFILEKAPWRITFSDDSVCNVAVEDDGARANCIGGQVAPSFVNGEWSSGARRDCTPVFSHVSERAESADRGEALVVEKRKPTTFVQEDDCEAAVLGVSSGPSQRAVAVGSDSNGTDGGTILQDTPEILAEGVSKAPRADSGGLSPGVNAFSNGTELKKDGSTSTECEPAASSFCSSSSSSSASSSTSLFSSRPPSRRVPSVRRSVVEVLRKSFFHPRSPDGDESHGILSVVFRQSNHDSTSKASKDRRAAASRLPVLKEIVDAPSLCSFFGASTGTEAHEQAEPKWGASEKNAEVHSATNAVVAPGSVQYSNASAESVLVKGRPKSAAAFRRGELKTEERVVEVCEEKAARLSASGTVGTRTPSET